MSSSDLLIWAMVLTPGVIAVAAFVGAIMLFRRSSEEKNGWLFTLLASFLMLFALGVGACYAMTCSGAMG